MSALASSRRTQAHLNDQVEHRSVPPCLVDDFALLERSPLGILEHELGLHPGYATPPVEAPPYRLLVLAGKADRALVPEQAPQGNDLQYRDI